LVLFIYFMVSKLFYRVIFLQSTREKMAPRP
jgi:hypothetical protein